MHDIFKGDLDLNKELAKFEDTLRENFGGVSKSMLALNESIIDIKEH